MSVRFQIAVNPSWRAKNSKGITMPNMLKRELFITFFFSNHRIKMREGYGSILIQMRQFVQ
jgi:hypothetical protein